MRRLLRLPSTYIAWPMLVACAVTAAIYDLPAGYGDGLVSLALGATGSLIADAFGTDRLPAWAGAVAVDYAGTREGFVALALAMGVLGFCLLDVTLFPVALIHDPSLYATMEGGHEHIRRIADMCWILPVVGMLCTHHRPLRYALILAGFAFPILVVDRNRLFAAVIGLAMVTMFRRDPKRPLPWRSMLVLGLAGATAFSLLGILRSGSVDTVDLPFGKVYRAAPAGIQWLLLYISAGPYNFASMMAKGFQNADILLAQMVPGAGAAATVLLPLDASNVNVGSEFMPFLVAWGPGGALAAMAVLYALMCWSVRRFTRSHSLFALLVFLRMAYVCVMAPFAPQAFIWMNFGFLGLCLVLQVVAAWLPSRARAEPHDLTLTH
ncbi:hypothetical protein L2Y96_03970 [Luteibacter aegosomaticola]|uniref:hypothetical protein n=1 Tax=Luteibacter aegosomaticola TaxID=2911538 RepID=UPI001FF8E7E5|nr:hypothetical protein [Luteibacter aegosomaticola]UPG90943.1 hypothetical protein L2Y96_03970 [Luteibacter aegosomaticola]